MNSTIPSNPIYPSNGYHLVHHIPGRVRYRIPLLGQHPHWSEYLHQRLQQIPEITKIRINVSAQSLIIHYHQITESHINPILSELISDQTGIEKSFKVSDSSPPKPEASDPGDWSSLQLPAVSVLLFSLSRLPQLKFLRFLGFLTFLATAFPIFQRAAYSLLVKKRLNIDTLDFLALSLSASQGKLFTAAMVIALHEFGDVIREQTARSTEVQTANLMDAIGHWAWIKQGDAVPRQIPSDQVQVGDTVVVYPGEQIPVDGTIVQGEAVIDQQSLTGESMPVVRSLGQGVFASSLVRSGQLYIHAERVAQQTRAAASLELLKKAPVYDTRIANYAEKVADRLILPSLLLAMIVLLTTRDRARVAAILTLDFVTGIRVSIPTAFLGALNHTTRHGILVRSGRTLEQLANIDTMVFDKTGTLTQGRIAIVGVKTVDSEITPSQVLQWAAAAEQRLNHPVAEAIVEAVRHQQLRIPKRDEWAYEVGLGVRAEIEGREILVGSQRFLQQENIDWGCWTLGSEAETESLIYVACDRIFQGVIEYRDPLRPESQALIQVLQRDYDIQVHLLTGDNPERATQVATQLGIPANRVYAEAFPEQKAQVVRDLRRAGRTVAFVGDGLNDSVALAYSDVSISFQQGSEIARETADVVLMNNNLLDVVEAISIARQTRRLIEQNTALVIAPNLIALGLATTRGLNPLIATVIHNGSAITAAVNSLRPLLQHQIHQGRFRLG